MAKFRLGITFVLLTYLNAMVLLCQDLEPIDTWFQNIQLLPVPKFAVIVFYDQDVLANNGETSYEIASASITSTSPTNFGGLFMVDNQLTAGPLPNSPAIGRRQGLLGFCGLSETAVCFSFNFIFNGGLYNGSTISVLGRRPVPNNQQELSIVGGTGYFRLAKGIAVLSTYVFNTTGDSIYKYTLYVTYL